MKTFTLKPTKDPDVFRVMDLDENWRHYFVASKNVYLDGVTTILNFGYSKGPRFHDYLLSKTREEAEKILKETGEHGNRVHTWIDNVLNLENQSKLESLVRLAKDVGVYSRESKDYEPIDNEDWSCILSFEQFFKKHRPMVIANEIPLYNVSEGYCGTTDAILVLTRACESKYCKCEPLIGKVGVWDWKTASGIRASYSAQNAAYSHAENLSVHLPKGTSTEYLGVLRLGTDHVTNGGYEIRAYFDDEKAKGYTNAWERFLAAKKIFDFENKPFDPTEIQDIPDEVEILVKRFDMNEFKKLRTTQNTLNTPAQLSGGEKKQNDGKSKRNRKSVKRTSKIAPRK